MKVASIPLFLGLGSDREYWNDKRLRMLPEYLGIEVDGNGNVPIPSPKQKKILQARALARLSTPVTKTPQ